MAGHYAPGPNAQLAASVPAEGYGKNLVDRYIQ